MMSTLAKGLGASLLFQVAVLLVRVMEAPLFVGLLGVSAYGEWLLISTIPMILAVADLGIGKAAQRDMTMALAAGETARARATFMASLVSVGMISTAVSIAAVLIIPRIDVGAMYRFESLSENSVVWAAALLVVQACVFILMGVALAGIAAAGRLGQSIVIQSISMLLGFGGLGVGLAVSKNIHIGVAVSLSASAVSCVAMTMYSARLIGAAQLKPSWTDVKVTWRRLLRPSIAGLSFPLGEAISTQGVRFLIGAILGPIALAQFATLRTIARVALQPMLAMSRVVESEMSSAYGEEDPARIRKLFSIGVVVAAATTTLGGCFLYFFGEIAYRVWTHGQMEFEPKVLGTLLAAALMSAIAAVSLSVSAANNSHIKLAGVFFVVNVFLLPLVVAIGSTYAGMVGSAAGILIAETLFMIVCWLSARRRVSLVPSNGSGDALFRARTGS